MSGAVGQQFEAAQSKVLLQPPGDAPAAPAPGPNAHCQGRRASERPRPALASAAQRWPGPGVSGSARHLAFGKDRSAVCSGHETLLGPGGAP